MNAGIGQLELFRSPGLTAAVEEAIYEVIRSPARPSANELLALLDNKVGILGRLDVSDVLRKLIAATGTTSEARRYLSELLNSDDLQVALRGSAKKRLDIESSIDELLRASKVYRSSQSFREMIEFMGKFREYSAYNNMLVRAQDPSCSFYATARDWRRKFQRRLKEDARPMLILAPMRPVMLVYSLDETDGAPLPQQLEKFAQFEGGWDSKWLKNLVANAKRHRVRVEFRGLSKTHGGFAQSLGPLGQWKCRITIHRELDQPSRFGVLCHEVAHILLGHLGNDEDGWWPARAGVGRRAAEIEAEGVAYIVATRLGLTGSSAAYVSGYVKDGQVPDTVSIDYMGKVAGRIQSMAEGVLPAPTSKPKKSKKPTPEATA